MRKRLRGRPDPATACSTRFSRSIDTLRQVPYILGQTNKTNLTEREFTAFFWCFAGFFSSPDNSQ
jgi:hypothetical protein